MKDRTVCMCPCSNNCPESFCSRVSTQLNVACKVADFSHGAPYPLVMKDRTVCMCPCSKRRVRPTH
jgi:hypothetical protein